MTQSFGSPTIDRLLEGRISRARASRRWKVLAAVSVAVSFGHPACADEEAVFRLVIVRGAGAESCPDGDAIGRSVSARLGREVFTDRAPSSIEGFLEHRRSAWTAHLFVRDASGGLAGKRDLSSAAADCAPIASAVALAIALAIDPEAALRPVRPREPTPSPPPPPPPPPPAWPMREPPALPLPPAVAPPSERRIRQTETSLDGIVAGGVLPGVAAGARLRSDITIYRWLRGSVGALYLPEVRTRGGDFGFGLTAGSVGASASAWAMGRFGIGAGVHVLAGSLHSVAYAFEPTSPGDRLWSAVSGEATVRLQLAGPLSADLGAELLVPMTRDTFVARGVSGVLLQESDVAIVGSAGLSVTIP